MQHNIGTSEKNYIENENIINLRFNHNCGNFKLFKSDYVKNNYSNLLLVNENNKNYYKNLIKLTNKNSNIKNNLIKLMIQYAELIKKYIDELENIRKTDTNFIDETENNVKYDIMILYWLQYINYHDALVLLSELKTNNNTIYNYDIMDRIDVLNYKTNLSAIQFIYAKIDCNLNFERYEIDNDLTTINEINKLYQINHNDNLLNKIKEIDSKYSEKIVEGFNNNKIGLINFHLVMIVLLLTLILLNK